MTKRLIKEHGIVFSEEPIAKIMVNNSTLLIKDICHSKKVLEVLEPSVGDGSLIVELLKHIPKHIQVNIDCLDIHKDFLKNTEINLQNHTNVNLRYIHADYLEFTPGKTYDIIISNPPYVRTATVGANKSKALKEKFGLSGKIDLYHAFFAKMIDELSTNGLLTIITSNKYLYNKTGESLRKKIINNLHIDTIIDLGDTKLFDAAVLPSILIGRKQPKEPTKNQFISVYEDYKDTRLATYPIMQDIDSAISRKHTNFIFNNTNYILKTGSITIKNNEILLLDNHDKDFINKMDSDCHLFLSDVATVKVGIKSTADKVFISKDFNNKVEDEIIHPLVVSKSINKWKIKNEKKKYILYPYHYHQDHKQVISLSAYPKAKKYFIAHEEPLKKRTYIMDSNREWFEIWVPHTPKLWKSEKIVFKDISSHGVFAYDKGSIVNGDSYMIILKDDMSKDYLYLMLGVLNSSIIAKYHEIRFPNKLYSNKRRFNSQYVQRYPLPDINNEYSQKIIAEVKKILQNEGHNLAESEYTINSLSENAYLSS